MAEFKNSGPMSARTFGRLDKFFLRNFADAKLIYDHGCGYGGWTNHISSLIGAQMSIFDPDVDAYKYTNSLLNERLSQSKGPFDAIMCFAVLELLDGADQLKLLREFHDLVTGSVILQYNVYNPYSPRWIALRAAHGNPISWHENHRFHRSYLTPAQVDELIHNSGFEIVEKCCPVLEAHLPPMVNNLLAPMVPSRFHSTIYYALSKK